MIKAITFDLWDTVFIDDSDEPKRKAKGLLSKPKERREIIHRFLSENNDIDKNTIDLAYNVVDVAFRHVWYEQNTTWTVSERLSILLKGLGYSVPQEKLAEMVRLHEEMELEIMPDIAYGIAESIHGLSKSYKLGVISDTIFSPGRVLKEILRKYELLDCFSAFIFSDEVKCAKPNPKVFTMIADQLSVSTNQIIHIGDREEKDVDGPHSVGAKAALTTVVKDRRSKPSKAELVCSDYTNLIEQIASLT